MRKKKTILQTMFRSCFVTTAVIEFSTVGAGLIDGLIISRFLGANSMAALGLAHPIFSVAGVFSGVLSVGMQSLNSSLLARGKGDEMRKLFTMTMMIALGISVILTAVMLACTDGISWIFGARGNAAELLGDTSSYLRGLAVGCVPLVLNVVFASGVQTDSGGSLVRRAALAGAVTDIVFDIAAVRFGWGMFGMGLASSLSYIVNFAGLLLHFRRKTRMLRLDFDCLPWHSLGKILKFGGQKATFRAMNILRPLLLNTMIISAGGALGMSALSVRNNVSSFLEIVMIGISETAALLIGIAHGEKNKEECRQIGRFAHRYAAVCSAAVIVIMALFARPISGIFVEEQGELFELVVFSMYCLAADLFFSTLLLSRISYDQETHQLKKCQLLVCLTRCFAVVPCAFVCVNLWGSRGVIAAFPVSDILICGGIFVYYFIIRKDRKKLLPTADDYLALGEDFDVKPQDIIELAIVNEEEAALSAEQLQLFCRGHKFDPEKGRRAALCLEELTVNIIEHGFPASKTVRPIDLRVVISGEDLILRIRDYCPWYDITKAMQMITEETAPEQSPGLKIIAKTAKEISYVNMLKMNVTIIRL